MNGSLGRQPQRGFSLIELMIALTLSAFVTAGIVQMFISNNQTYNLLTGQSRMQENARFALDFLVRAARSAGNIGCAPEDDKIVSALGGDFDQLFEYDITTLIEGFEGGAGGAGNPNDWAPSLNNLPRTVGGVSFNTHIDGNGVPVDQVAPGTDVIVFRQVRAPGYPVAQVTQPTAAPVVFAPNGVDFAANDIVMIADCERASMFKVTGLAVNGNNVTLQVGTGPTLYDNAAPFSLTDGDSYGVDSAVGAIETTIFYIAPGTGTNNRGNAPLSLWRKVSDQAPVELIEGIEDLEVLFGIDTTLTDNVANVNQYVTADNVPDLSQVVTLRLTITANSVNAVTDQGDGLLRRSFTETVTLRNARPGA